MGSMPSLKVHCAISKKRTGRTYEKLHRWIDEDKDDCGVNHRSKNHVYTAQTKEEVAKFGGREAVEEWLFNIALDSLHTYYKNRRDFTKEDENFMRFGFAKSGYIFYEGDFLDDTKDQEIWLEEFETYGKEELGLLDRLANAVLGDEVGYCIRCKKEIEPDEKHPYCKECYNSWKKYKNVDYREKYCHYCGNPYKSSLNDPLCKECRD